MEQNLELLEQLKHFGLMGDLLARLEAEKGEGKAPCRKTIERAHILGPTTFLRKRILEISQELVSHKQNQLQGQKATA